MENCYIQTTSWVLQHLRITKGRKPVKVGAPTGFLEWWTKTVRGLQKPEGIYSQKQNWEQSKNIKIECVSEICIVGKGVLTSKQA